ncbi:MAG: fatty acyl-AMP ligase [Oscillatoriales cyanobacterium]|uniref:fatty acyl-AMP ligase n=1 Tax=Microcoleus anatoxicus TaxID=2705319 RepID=UPI0029774585|nr:MAG: fatty acyl-AMP ligase [Oscillatoriales cyanobacterium]TAF46781.1 MAG: fatty acyl-AMP ligase [Oscillatoriales cyanobacterium]TAF70783.1 MAG: fatty acyl-AMP ligase [Oscillatoriales cyanobacterium]
MDQNKFSTLISMLEQRAIDHPQKVSHTFLQEGKTETGSLTYQQLDQQARAIAVHIQNLTAKGERAILLYPQGLEVIVAFYGCLYAGVVAVPTPLPDVSYLKQILPKLQAIIKDAQPSVILTTFQLKSIIDQLAPEIPDFQNLHWLITDKIALDSAQEWQDPEVTDDSLAYLQYTSGSTSAPKGVMISHRNILDNLVSSNQGSRIRPESSITTWLPYFHDYGLVTAILQPVYADIPCYFMSPVAFIKYPLRWLEAISRYRSTHNAGPSFAYDYCVHKIKPEERLMLDLSCWKVATIGAESISQKTLESFVEAFGECGFRQSAFDPGYGLAEATLTISCTAYEREKPIFCSVIASELEKNRIVEASSNNPDVIIRTIAGCGQPIPGMKVVIVHPEKLTQCQINEVGEIWVSSASVANGYWNNSSATALTFQAYLKDTDEGPFLRTGDLGFIQNGELFVTGRLKDLIIIGGTNHYPQDIELTVEKSNSLIVSTCSAAFSINVEGQEQLVVVAEINHNNQEGQETEISKETIETIIKGIRELISKHHQLRVCAIVLLKYGTIPRTLSGKIQRFACRKYFLEGNFKTESIWREDYPS